MKMGITVALTFYLADKDGKKQRKKEQNMYGLNLSITFFK